MSYSIPGLPRGYRYPQNAALSSFAGGLNRRDAASELAANEVIDAWNVTFDERGGAASRLGYVKYNASVYGSATIVNMYWSAMLGINLVQAGASLYKGASTTAVKTFSTSELVDFAELNHQVVACHPTDGLFVSTDGVTWTAVSDPNAPHGLCCCVWQNKLWVGRADGSVAYSNAGTATVWTATDFNDLWEHNTEPVVALHVASGEDIVGNALLYAFKRESWYVIEDSTTGEYRTVDATVGAANARSVVGAGPYVYALGKHGIFRAAGAQVGATDMSGRLQPLWDSGQIDTTQQAIWAAGRRKNRVLFSLTRAGAAANNLALELHTEQGWLTAGSRAMSCYMMSQGQNDATYGGSPSVAGQAYQLDVGGTDDGAAISGWLQTRWMDLLGGYNASVLHLRLRGRGTGSVEVRKNFQDTGTSLAVAMVDSTSTVYDAGLTYDSGVAYFVPSEEPQQVLYGIGAARQLSLKFSFTSSSTWTPPQIFGSGTPPQLGGFAIFAVEAIYMRLGLS